jgi:DNA-binding NarL/FixJ family response regulator
MTPPTASASPPTPIRVLLADDQTLVRAVFAMLVESANDTEIVAQAGPGREAVELARSAHAELVAMDMLHELPSTRPSGAAPSLRNGWVSTQ